MSDLFRLCWNAFFLSETPYAETRESPNSVLRGLGTIILVALVVALVGLVGTTLEWASTPNMNEVQATVLENLQNLPWYQMLDHRTGFSEEFSRWYNLGWRVFPYLFGAPNVGIAASQIILLPLRLTLAWILYGLVSYLCARLLGGQGSLGQTLGCTALAVAPQLLNVLTIFPYLIVGGIVGTWTLLCRYVALKTCHRLTWGRALAATLLPYIVYIVTISLFACMGGMVFSYLVSEGVLQ
ncbi:MAG: YIP1 family protein [Chloroflexi bacterium]|nr:YIP1 family protein [Chloroflexota bacterium]